jgi:ubiquinone/menaquinone biosynthesis C-methylase UbiE
MTDEGRQGQYNENFIIALQWLWGDGYLAPGGAAEVAELLSTVDLSSCRTLDVGSGLGAIGVLLADKYGASEVVGIDVEAHLIKHSQERATKAGLADRVRFQLVEPGPLPFEDGSFDVVFTKDAIVHISYKPAFYAEVLRILKPGGLFVGSDWLRGGSGEIPPIGAKWLEFVHLNFLMKNLDETRDELEGSGFMNVSMNDRNAWYQNEVKAELAALEGDRFEGLAERIGLTQAQYRLESSQLKKEAIDAGFLRPTHFVGYKPA